MYYCERKIYYVVRVKTETTNAHVAVYFNSVNNKNYYQTQLNIQYITLKVDSLCLLSLNSNHRRYHGTVDRVPGSQGLKSFSLYRHYNIISSAGLSVRIVDRRSGSGGRRWYLRMVPRWTRSPHTFLVHNNIIGKTNA